MGTDFIGYSALVTNLVSMNMKNIVFLRILAGIANLLYLIYGLLLQASPIIIGCTIAVSIHSYHLYKLYNKTNCPAKS